MPGSEVAGHRNGRSFSSFHKAVVLTFENSDTHHDDHDDLDTCWRFRRDLRELRDRRVST
jgi:hypothetical protein